MSIEDSIREMRELAEADAKAERLRAYGLPTREDVLRSDEREPINIEPGVKKALIRLLMHHPRFEATGIGFSEFIRSAIARELEDV